MIFHTTRSNTQVVDHPTKPDVQFHTSLFIVTVGDKTYDFLEIREFNTAAEIYGHGTLIPEAVGPALHGAIYETLGLADQSEGEEVRA